MTERVYIGADGAIILGSAVVCDGFDPTCGLRVQTHIHADHTGGIASSKGVGDILATDITRDLLIQEFNSDLAYRNNLRQVSYGIPYDAGNGALVVLHEARHMPGSAQVLVVHEDSFRSGYSGDFSWPLDAVLDRPDILVLDATWGSPDGIRKYSQVEADERFVSEALRRVRYGPVFVYAHRGTLHRAIGLLDDATNMPLLGSPRLVQESLLYQRHGHIQAHLIDHTSPEGKATIASDRYIMFIGKGDPRRDLCDGQHKITLSAYTLESSSEPYLEYSEYSCRIAFSEHADFEGTLAYVQAVAPAKVLTDASRSQHAQTLASEISRRLAIPASVGFPVQTRPWS